MKIVYIALSFTVHLYEKAKWILFTLWEIWLIQKPIPNVYKSPIMHLLCFRVHWFTAASSLVDNYWLRENKKYTTLSGEGTQKDVTSPMKSRMYTSRLKCTNWHSCWITTESLTATLATKWNKSISQSHLSSIIHWIVTTLFLLSKQIDSSQVI